MDNTRSRTADIDWQAIHESIQVIFLSFAEVVQAECPCVRSRTGKTQTARFPLFSYRTFDIPSQPDLDPVVAGVNFKPDASGRDITVTADLCGEESGRIWLELPEQIVSAAQDSLRAAAETFARKLSEQKDRLLVALNQPKTVSSPRVGTQDNGIGIAPKEYESHP